MDHGMYPGNKRANEDVSIGPNDNKRNRNAPGPTSRPEFRFLVAASDANAIFGRNGERYQMMRNKYHNQIDVSSAQAPERVIVFFGEEDRVMLILSDILQIMAQNQAVRPGSVELRAMIHSSQAGAIIGKSGDRIKEFRQKYNLDTKVFPNSTPADTTERVLSLRGDIPNIINCLKEVYMILSQTPIRGPVRNYDPAVYDGVDVERYGGFPENHDFQTMRPRFSHTNNSQQQQPPPQHYHHQQQQPPPQQHFHQQQQQQHHYQYSQQQHGGNFHNRGPPPPMNYPPNQAPMPTTTQVTIPHALSSLIIGPRGTRIAQIRQQSGCVIKIDDPLPSNNRIISIIGFPNNIMHAQYLMQTAVKQSQQWNSSSVSS